MFGIRFENRRWCTVLDMPRWRKMTAEIDRQSKQPSQVACASERLKCWGARNTTCGQNAKDVTPSIALWRKAHKEEALGDLPWKDENGPCISPIRRTLELFKRQRWGKFRAHRYHPKLNLSVIRHCPVGSIPQAARLVSHLTNSGPLLPNIDIGNYGRNRSATLQPYFFLPLPPSFCHRDIRSESWWGVKSRGGLKSPGRTRRGSGRSKRGILEKSL